MKKIAIIGAGVVGINCILRLIDEREDVNTEIIWIYDSSSPIFGIGESTTPGIPSQISHTTNLSFYHAQEYFDATVKYGNKFIGWGNKHNFIHWLDLHYHGIHFDTYKFSEFFLDSLPKTTKGLTLLDQKIDDINITDDGIYLNGVRYDFVIDCAGKSLLDQDLYFDSPYPTVNTCLAVRLPEPADWNFTISYAHKNGWMFGIPLKTRRTWGYCYNSDITTEEEALNDLKSIIKRDDIEYRKIEWKQRFSHYMLHPSGRYGKNGNALGFLEPLESFAGAYYDNVSNHLIWYALYGHTKDEKFVDENNDWYFKEVVDDWLKNVSWMYHFGSKYDTPFWNMVKDVSKKYLNDPDVFDINNKMSFTDELWDYVGNDDELVQKFVWHELDYALKIELNQFIKNYRDFIEVVDGMGATYSDKFPRTAPMVLCPEPHGELSQEI